MLSHTQLGSAPHSCCVGFLRAQPGEHPVAAVYEHKVFAAQSAEVLAFEHVPTQEPVVESHAQSGSVVHAACALYLYWHRAVQPVPLTTWQVAEAAHVAGSATTEHLPVQADVSAFHTQSLCESQEGPVVARKAQRVTHVLPRVLHMLIDSQLETLMGSVTSTGIWSHDSVHTKFELSHMQAGLPEQLACVVYVSEQCWAHCLLTFQKQLTRFEHVVLSLMPEQICEQVMVLLFHVHVTSPLQSVCVERWLHWRAQLPVEVTLQSGRDVQSEPTYGHCVTQALWATDQEHVAAFWQSTSDNVEQLAWQTLLTLSHAHEPSDLAQPDLVSNF